MCGILGYLGKREFDAAAFGRALDVMTKRGPDDRGVYEEAEVLLGARRLAILDTSLAGHQPMVSDDGRFVIVYNGEIYNFLEIRTRLERKGIVFKSQSDTEVILASYAARGHACLNEFRGMFAIAIYDRREKSLFLARDRMGIKPLYVWRFPGGIAFASEVKALRSLPGGPSEISPLGLWQYLLWGSVPEPHCILDKLTSVEPATWLEWSEGRERQGRYWDYHVAPPRWRKREDAIDALQPVLREAVALRCIADVPVGAFLSGGVDSSSVVSLMRTAGQKDLRTFSISFPQTDLDEGPYAVRVAEQFGTLHEDVSVTDHMVQHELDGFFASMDQPTADGLNTYLISKIAKQGGVTVALCGLGGDELFAGYPSFRRSAMTSPLVGGLPSLVSWASRKASDHLGRKLQKLEAIGLSRRPVDRLYFLSRGLFMPSQARGLMKEDLLAEIGSASGESEDWWRLASGPFHPMSGQDVLSSEDVGPVHSTMRLEITRYMRNQLLRDSDVFGMASSLEIRVPLIDHKLVEVLFTTPGSMILKRPAKSLLLDALPSALPRVCTHRPKMGFTLPFDTWMRGMWRPILEEGLFGTADHGWIEGEVLDPDGVKRCWRDYLRGRVHWSRPWALYSLRRALAKL
ncbi:MAG TPA: asparagine synthase (glutamine-hydrolyzing) [Thermoanaerobaculaceae bacterium]|nr:asparagine synthase (glutamine-hydrolyzing) [Thermoanaerobaculaceae bacterium]